MGKSSRSDSQQQPPRGSSSATSMELSATEHAILGTLCRPYVAGQSFPSPASDSRILGELAIKGMSLDRDTLRTQLQGLYVKFAVDEGLRPRDKRVRLVERVYEHGLITGWSDATLEQRAPTGEQQTHKRMRATVTRVVGFVREQPDVAARLGAVVIAMSVLALASALGLWGL